MIPKEIKGKIFALYWTQNILLTKSVTYPIPVTQANWLMAEPALLVKPLSQITDEDTIEIASFVYTDPHDKEIINARNFIMYNFACCGLTSYEVSEINLFEDGDIYQQTIDYLRSKGYALPAFGYSIDKLIEEGMFKLTV